MLREDYPQRQCDGIKICTSVQGRAVDLPKPGLKASRMGSDSGSRGDSRGGFDASPRLDGSSEGFSPMGGARCSPVGPAPS